MGWQEPAGPGAAPYFSVRRRLGLVVTTSNTQDSLGKPMFYFQRLGSEPILAKAQILITLTGVLGASNIS